MTSPRSAAAEEFVTIENLLKVRFLTSLDFNLSRVKIELLDLSFVFLLCTFCDVVSIF